jgi:DNA replication protein DnaC
METLEQTLDRLSKGNYAGAAIVNNTEAEVRQHKAKVDDILRVSNAPARHLKRAHNVDRDGKWGKTAEWLRLQCGRGYFVALVGKRGPGKTQLAVDAMLHHAEKLKTVRYTTATGFLMRVKGTYKPQEMEDESDIITMFVRPALLVIDEYTRRGETDWEDRLLFELLDRRYNAMRDTILIANLTKADFEEAIGPSLASRMEEAGGIIECEWESYR